MVIDRTGLTGK
jgi:uncharacterized protein (TIGR03435 family)